MNNRLRYGPPKHRLAQRSGSAIRPIGSPLGEKNIAPSRPPPFIPQPHQRLPSSSQRKPSGVPSPASINVLGFPSFLPSSRTSKARIRVGPAPSLNVTG